MRACNRPTGPTGPKGTGPRASSRTYSTVPVLAPGGTNENVRGRPGVCVSGLSIATPTGPGQLRRAAALHVPWVRAQLSCAPGCEPRGPGRAPAGSHILCVGVYTYICICICICIYTCHTSMYVYTTLNVHRMSYMHCHTHMHAHTYALICMPFHMHAYTAHIPLVCIPIRIYAYAYA